MKKLLFVLLILVIVGGSAFAFNPLSYPPVLRGGGSTMVDAGIGYWYSDWLHLGSFGIPPLFVNVEYALPIGFPISVGGGLSFFQWKVINEYTLTWVTPQARASWHWGFDINSLDLYTGISLGYSIVSTNVQYLHSTIATSSGLYWGIHAGAHYYFSDNIGAMIETGYPFLGKAGIALKF